MWISRKLSLSLGNVRDILNKEDRAAVTHPDVVPDRSVFISCDSSVASNLHSAQWLAACSQWAETLLVTFPDRCLGPASRMLRDSRSTAVVFNAAVASGVAEGTPPPGLMLVSHEQVAEVQTHRQLPLMQELSAED
jgi:hypothetical protein